MKQSDQSLPIFKVGDKVVFDMTTYDNIAHIPNKNVSYLDRGVFTVIDRDGDRMTLDRAVFKHDSHGAGWPDYHFKPAKTQIVKQILNDLL